MLCDVASIFVVRTLIVSQAYTMVLTLIDNTRIHIFMYSIGETGASWSMGQVGPRAITLN